MDFTFGIVTGGGCDERIREIISSIEELEIPNYEVLVVGPTSVRGGNITTIPFDETVKKAWITRKKNLITNQAKYENIVYLHDYITFDRNWYQGFLDFGNDFEAVMCRMNNFDGTRYRDWCLWSRNHSIIDWVVYPNRTLISYDLTEVKSHLYFSGAFWVAKKSFMENCPLNEDLVAGQAEDVEWSKRAQEFSQFKLNNFSMVNLLKTNLVVAQEPGKFRMLLISKLLTNSLIDVDMLYKKIPSRLEDLLYRQLQGASKVSVPLKMFIRRLRRN
jgi:hypothetical protein